MKTAAQLREELQEAAITSFRVPLKFGSHSPEQNRASAVRCNLLPQALIAFLDFQERCESTTERPLLDFLPFKIEVGDVAAYFNNTEAREWLFPFARDSQGSLWASWTWGVPILSAPVVFLDATRKEQPQVVASYTVEFFRRMANEVDETGDDIGATIRRDFIAWTQEHVRVSVVSPTADVTEWMLPDFPDFGEWCQTIMR